MEWISIKKQEPPYGERILVLKYYKHSPGKSYVDIDSYHGELEYERNRVGKIIYWMPLPNAPQEKIKTQN